MSSTPKRSVTERMAGVFTSPSKKGQEDDGSNEPNEGTSLLSKQEEPSPPRNHSHGHGHGHSSPTPHDAKASTGDGCSSHDHGGHHHGHGHDDHGATEEGHHQGGHDHGHGHDDHGATEEVGGFSMSAKQKEATRKLKLAMLFCILFIIAEVIGGFIANSLAIMTDAAHLLSDVAGYLISLFAIWMGSFPPTATMSYGFYRAEVIGAAVSIQLIWGLTFVLLYQACFRFYDIWTENPDMEVVDGKIMFIIACMGLIVNLILIKILGGHDAGEFGHSHGGGGGHSHGHSHGGPKKHKPTPAVTPLEEKSGDGPPHGHDHSSKSHNHGGEHTAVDVREAHAAACPDDDDEENINVRAAYIHAIGDLIQSVGVCIAGALIWWNPDLQLADPIATLLFSLMVFMSTLSLIKSSFRVLMEGSPEGFDPETIGQDIKRLPNVIAVHDLHMWSLTLGKPALSVHVVCDIKADGREVLKDVVEYLRSKKIKHSTIQIEESDPGFKCHIDTHRCYSHS